MVYNIATLANLRNIKAKVIFILFFCFEEGVDQVGFVEHRAIRLVAESDLFLWCQASLERVDST